MYNRQQYAAAGLLLWHVENLSPVDATPGLMHPSSWRGVENRGRQAPRLPITESIRLTMPAACRLHVGSRSDHRSEWAHRSGQVVAQNLDVGW